jgi:RimJ/RimL family protein N-acetyltransferase
VFGLRLKPEIETKRLRLRTPEAGDVDRIVELVNDIDIARMTTGIPHPYTVDHGKAFIAMVEHSDPDMDLPLLIEHKVSGPVGIIGLHRRDAPWPEMGYWLGRHYWGLGIATEAALGLMKWSSEARGHRALAAGHFDDNPASGRVLEKLGFLYTGEVRVKQSLGREVPSPTRMMVWLA